jgi:hypothetical protein
MTLLFWLITKHFVADFLYQPPWMWKNKGTFWHPGGIAHAGLHALLSFSIVWFYSLPQAAVVAFAEFIAHYVIDYCKMNVNAFFGWRCDASEKFWWLLGFDQYLHYLCYLLIALYLGVIT